LFYELRDDFIEAVALVYERRKPGFWLARRP
jgi:hypothetical protein